MNLIKITSFIFAPVFTAVIVALILLKISYSDTRAYIGIIMAGVCVSIINTVIVIIQISKK